MFASLKSSCARNGHEFTPWETVGPGGMDRRVCLRPDCGVGEQRRDHECKPLFTAPGDAWRWTCPRCGWQWNKTLVKTRWLPDDEGSWVASWTPEQMTAS